jgi:hypothetical protein
LPKESAGKAVGEYEEEERRVRNVCEALKHMEHLRVFTWSANTDPISVPTVLPRHEEMIIEALRGKPTLVHVGLSGKFATMSRPLLEGAEGGYPVCVVSWRI